MNVTTKFEKRLKVAVDHYREGNYSAAIKSLKKLQARYPNQSDVYFHLGVTYGSISGEEKNAISFIAKATHLNPNKYEYYLQMAPYLMLLGEYDDVVELADFMIKGFPKLANGYATKAHILMSQGETKMKDIMNLQNKARQYPGYVFDDEARAYDSSGEEDDTSSITKVSETLIDISAYLKTSNPHLIEYNECDQALQVFLEKVMVKYESSDQVEVKTTELETIDLFTYYEDD